jgi:hypothetical protein
MNIYFSVDLELSGGVVGKHSMIALGACIVGNTHKNFYREIKPISPHYAWTAMKKATLGLQCIPNNLKHRIGYDPDLPRFRPEYILRLLYRCGSPPRDVLHDFNTWIKEESGTHTPIMVAKPVSVEKPVLEWYAQNFSYPYPFTGEEDLIESFQSLFRKKEMKLRDLAIPDSRLLEHNGLEDCVLQADQFEAILKLRAQSQKAVLS